MATPLLQLTRVLPDEDATRELGRALAEAVVPLPAGGFLIDLRGDLGMGKTVLVQGIAQGLGVPHGVPVVSPTFTIARSYRAITPGDPIQLHHLDAYRLGGVDDLEAVGFEELCGDGALTCVEWGSRVAEGLPADRLEIALDMDPASPHGAPAPGEIPVFARRAVLSAWGPEAEGVLQRLSTLDALA